MELEEAFIRMHSKIAIVVRTGTALETINYRNLYLKGFSGYFSGSETCGRGLDEAFMECE